MSNGHFQDSPRPGRPERPARPRRKARRNYPVAQPYAPPPPGTVISRAPAADSGGNGVRTLLVVAGIVVACMAGGWYFFRGPVAAIIKSNTPAARARLQAEAEEAAQLALNPPTEKAPPKPEPRPLEKPKTEQLPAKPKDDPPVKPKVETPPPPPPPMPKPDKPPMDNPPVAGLSFEKHVLPIVEGKCKNCHNDEKKRGGLDLTSLAAILKGGESGPAVVPGMLDKSLMWKTVRDNEMPPTPNKLNPMERKVLEEWITAGARGAATAQAPKP